MIMFVKEEPVEGLKSKLQTEKNAMNKPSPEKNRSLKYHMENRRLKKKIKQLEEQSKEKSIAHLPALQFNVKTMLFIVTVSISVYLYIKHDDIIFSHNKVRFLEISKQLRTNVFHQHEAVELILENLRIMKDQQWRTEMFVMPFVGTSGVSKTYVADIIRQNTYHSYIHDITRNDLVTNFEQTYFDTLKNLQECCNLIIIEDLTSNDIDIVTRFITALPQHKVVLVVPIINIQDVNVVNNVLEYSVNDKCLKNIVGNFVKAGLKFKNVLFHVLSRDDLETAIIQLMLQRGVDYAKCGHLIKEILDNHDVATQGYKQLHHKLHVIWECGEDDIYSVNVQE